MHLTDYQDGATMTAIYPDAMTGSATALSYVGLGLSGEAGELSNQLKKVLRDDGGELTPERRSKLHDEMGDVLWYMALLAMELGLDLEAVAEANLSKLGHRQKSGEIQGDARHA